MKRILLTSLYIFLFATTAQAETLTLDQALSQALKNTPASARIARDLADRNARAREWETLQNPEMEIDNITFNTTGNDGLNTELTQPLKLSYFGDRQALAEAIRRTASLEERAQILAAMHDTTRRYLELWLLQQHAEFLKENLAFARKTNSTVQKAAKSGELQLSESHLFNAETLKFQEELRELETAIKARRLDFLQQLGMEAQEIELAHPQPPQPPATVEQLKALAEASPRQILESRREEAQQRLAVARSDAYLPEVSPRLLYSRGYDTNREEVGFGLRLSIPLWDRGEAEVSRAEAEKRFVDTSLAAYDRIGYDRLLESQREKATAATARLKQYEQAILPAYEKSFSATRDMFKGGQASVLQLWQVHERLHDVQKKTLEVHQEAFEAVMELETLLGQPLGTKQ